MSSLHTISKSWHDVVLLYEQLAFASAGDAILLLQDGVLALQSPTTLGSFTGKCAALDIPLYALENDCRLRGIQSQYSQIQLIDYVGFVGLVEQHAKQVAW